MENKVLYEVNGRIGYITLNRPEKRNALNEEMVKMLKDAFTKAEKDDAVKVVVLRAQGDTFCAGADLAYLKQLQKYSYEENLADSHNLMTLFKQIYIHPKVVIAQVEGHAIAGGGGLAAVCDFVFSVPEAKFGFTEVKIGFIPAIISVFIIRKLGEAVAKYLLLTGKLFDAKIMKNYFLVNEIVDRKNIADFVEKFAQNLCTTTSAQSLTNTKRLIADVQNLSFQEGLMYSAKLNAESRGNDDCKRGIEKFLNKENLAW